MKEVFNKNKKKKKKRKGSEDKRSWNWISKWHKSEKKNEELEEKIENNN